MSPEPVRRPRPARPAGPDRRAGPRRVAGHRRRHPPRPARRREPGPVHRRLRRLRRAAHPVGPLRGLRRPDRAALATTAWTTRPALHRTAARHPRRRLSPDGIPRGDPLAALVQLPTRIRRGWRPRLAHPRRRSCRVVSTGAETDPRHGRRPRRHHRADHLVRADRPPGPGRPAGTVNRPVPMRPTARRMSRGTRAPRPVPEAG